MLRMGSSAHVGEDPVRALHDGARAEAEARTHALQPRCVVAEMPARVRKPICPPGAGQARSGTRDRLLTASALAHAASTPFFFAVHVAT